MQLILSPEALDDITDILLYTLQTWGEAQQDTYAAAIDKSLQLLLDNPELGRRREELCANCRSYRVRQHIIYYIVRKDTINIARILHNRMDAKRHIHAED